MYKSISYFVVFNFLFSQLFFSEYAEGSGYNKYLEIYNTSLNAINLGDYSLSSCSNGCNNINSWDYADNLTLDGVSLESGEVFVVCHPSDDADISIQSQCDQTFTYLSNGDDAFGLTNVSTGEILDIIGDLGDDPGDGWSVAGINSATKDHTLVRKIDVTSGNSGNWTISAGTNVDDSEWIVLEQNEWSYVGFHPHDGLEGLTDDGGDDGGSSGLEICNDGIDNDGDSYIDCDDFDCSSDLSCSSGGSGSCAEYGCVGYTPSNACQCNDLCTQYNNCCDDYEAVCSGTGDGGSSGSEICDDGIDNDGDGYVDCDDYNCDGTIGDADPVCGGGTSGGGSTEICDDGIDNDGDGYVDCDDYNCDGTIGDADPVCGGSSTGGGSGSCAEYGCVGYTPSNACQCNDLCTQYNNCCDDYEAVCSGTGDGGSSGSEICDDGIDNDGDGYVDCDDYNCDGTIGDADPVCGGGTTGGGSGSENCTNGFDDDGDGYIDCNDFDCNGDVACPGEICDDGVDNDGDSYVDCDDYGCNNDPACSGGSTGGGNSCADFGCVGYTPSNPCQCNDLCTQYNNCCDDYEEVCGGSSDGGSSGSEICDDGIDNDGDGYVDCDDWNCDGTIGNADPACSGSTTGGGGSEECSNCIDDDGDGYIDCNDFDCDGDPACPFEICDDGIDNDGDSYIDCDDFGCSDDPACSSGDGGGGPCDNSSLADLFFSEYGEGSSNNKYLEIYNNSSETIDLCGYAYPNATNGANTEGTYDYWNEFDSGATIAPGDVYVLCHGSSDNLIQQHCDQNHTYLSNGDDGFCLVYGSENSFQTLDCIGDWSATDPGDGWTVAGVADGTKDHTLVRKPNVTSGNQGNWSLSAGTNTDDSEWIVYDQNTWDYVGSHVINDGGPIFGCTDESAYNYNSFATVDDGTCSYPSSVSISDIQGYTNASPYDGLPVISTGQVTGITDIGFYMQDGEGPWSGIWVFTQGASFNFGDFGSLTENSLVQVEGQVIEYNDLTEIEATNVSIISTDNIPLNPSIISTGDFNESYEGVLVQFNNAFCTALPNQYGEWEVNDGSGIITIDDKLSPYEPALNQSYTITGVGDYSYGIYKVQSKSVEEVFQGDYPVANAGNDQNVDFGDTVTLDGSNSSFDDGIIISYQWTQTSGANVNIIDAENAIASFTAPTEFSSLTFSLQVVNNLGNSSIDFVNVIVGQLGIYDIQYTTDVGSESECYPTMFDGQSVIVNGIVTAVRSFSSYPNFFIQDPTVDQWAGLYVYVSEMDALNVGDEVSLEAEVSESYNVTELTNLASYTVLSSGNNLPATPVSTGDIGIDCNESGEMYEGMLVSFSNAVVQSIDSYDNLYVDDGSGLSKVGDYFFNFDNGFWPDLNVGDTIDNVQGVVHYYFDEYVIYPSTLTDFEISQTEGFCADYGCGVFDEDNSCQCNEDCISCGNCCSDYEDVCIEGSDGGSDVCSDSILLGDLNVDGIVNVLDVITVVNYVIGALEDLSFDELCAADNNNDGIVNVLDIVAIVNTILDN